MVARDGIEPPTPAFSGPRSTTELSGLRVEPFGAAEAQPNVDVFIACLMGGNTTPFGRRTGVSKSDSAEYTNSFALSPTALAESVG